MNEAKSRSFQPGQIVITANARETLFFEDVTLALGRHFNCDWGDCSPDDAAENESSLDNALRLFSVYHDRYGVKFWIITEADRSATTILLPEDY